MGFLFDCCIGGRGGIPIWVIQLVGEVRLLSESSIGGRGGIPI